MRIVNVLTAAVLVLSLSAATAFAQNPIPNPGFENWSSGNPVGWLTSNDGVPGTVSQSTDRHSGAFAVRGDVVDVGGGFRAQPTIQTGDTGEGFATNKQWSALTGFYKLNAVSGDQLLFSVVLTKAGAAVGGGSMFITTNASTYQPLTIPLFYAGPDLPDSGFILVFLMGPLGGDAMPHLGSYFLLDDLDLTDGGQPPVCPITLTGDVNATGDRTTSDIIYMVNFVLKGGAVPLPCRGAGDVNCDGATSTSDIIYLVNSILKGGPAPCDVCQIIPGTWSCP